MNKMIVLVNPCRVTAQSYGTVLNSLGFDVIGLWSDVKHRDVWQFAKVKNLVLETTDVADLRPWLPFVKAFIPCDDKAFALADGLQMSHFSDWCNDPSKAALRYSKYEYLKYLADLGLTAPVYRPEDELPEGRYVAKPVDGAGNEDVFVFNSNEHISLPDRAMLIQRYVDGEELCVELVSSPLGHNCTSVMRYGGNHLVDGRHPWRESNYLVSPDSPSAKTAVEYAKVVVDALGVRLGVTWTQVKIDAEGRPNLIEVNFRPQGNAHLGAIRETSDTNYLRQSLQLYLGNLKAWTNEPKTFTKLGDFAKVSINVRRPGLKPQIDWDALRNLDSVRAVWVNHTLGETVRKSTGFLTSLATVILANTNRTSYEKDMQTIQRLKDSL